MTKFHYNNIISLGDINKKTEKQGHLDVRLFGCGLGKVDKNGSEWVIVGHSGS